MDRMHGDTVVVIHSDAEPEPRLNPLNPEEREERRGEETTTIPALFTIFLAEANYWPAAVV